MKSYTTKIANIYQQIERLKKELYILTSKYNLNHHLVVQCSQELDEFILKVQKFNQGSRS